MVSDWVLAIATVVLAIGTSVLAWATWNLFRATRLLAKIEEKRERRNVLETQVKMHQDIAAGNRWNWSPWDVTVGSYDYHEWDAWRARCISYAPRFTGPTYYKFAQLLAKKGDREEWDRTFKDVKVEAERQVAILQEQLARIDVPPR